LNNIFLKKSVQIFTKKENLAKKNFFVSLQQPELSKKQNISPAVAISALCIWSLMAKRITHIGLTSITPDNVLFSIRYVQDLFSLSPKKKKRRKNEF
jgi:hypothetical protein